MSCRIVRFASQRLSIVFGRLVVAAPQASGMRARLISGGGRPCVICRSFGPLTFEKDRCHPPSLTNVTGTPLSFAQQSEIPTTHRENRLLSVAGLG
ncbi:MAG: hypothetical protein C5B58_12205 [Acidobacteria bacterium]|nr:MAG: hypothetical protein C5B58_12205 [Acidobacteriota bacterium]